MLLREEFEKREHDIYRTCASFSDESKGRAVEEEKCDIRTDFQRDRDRIIHSKSFRMTITEPDLRIPWRLRRLQGR